MSALIHSDNKTLRFITLELRSTFLEKITEVSLWIGINPNWLMQVLFAESKINPQAQNIQKGRLIAAGLLQWTKASGMKGAPAAALKLTPLQQLDEVKIYFAPYRGKLKSYQDVYFAVFFPLALGKSDVFILQTKNLSADTIARQNKGVNINKDNKITVSEFKQYIINSTPNFVREKVFGMIKAAAPVVKATLPILLPLTFFFAYLIFKKK